MMRKQEAPAVTLAARCICKRRNRRSVAGPLISNGHCGVCSAKSKVAGSTPRCVVGLLKGGRVETEGGVPHGVWLRRRHRGAQAYLRGRLRRHQPGRRERLTHFRESGQRQVERSFLEFYRTRVLQISLHITNVSHLSPKCHPFTDLYNAFTNARITNVSLAYHSYVF